MGNVIIFKSFLMPNVIFQIFLYYAQIIFIMRKNIIKLKPVLEIQRRFI